MKIFQQALHYVCLSILWSALASPAFALEADSGAMSRFVVRKVDKLYVGNDEFRFVSFNIPNLHLVEDNFSFLKPNPWRWPNEFEIADALESVSQMGGNVVRMYVLSVHREGSDMGDHVFVRGPGDFNEHAFRVLDQVLAIAKEKGVRVIIPFVDNWHWWGGVTEYAKFRGKEPAEFWTDEQLIADFEATIRHTLNRKNTITGVAYKDDPTIFAWETGNELDSTPDWTRRIAATIKALDSKHLLIDGYALHGVRQESLDDPNIDVITTHHYPSINQQFVPEILTARKKTAGIKPYFVGEFGFVSSEVIENVLHTVIEQDVSGALLWSLRVHNRDGGFYWHWETDSDGICKAYHWPGFDSGESYNERKILAMMRNSAYAIRGLAVPARKPPIAPTLLPIVDVGAISWQGSTGAEHYDVERATNANGPWKVVARDVSDAQVQYRPLFNDESALVGETYFYRVRANNIGGRSPPSNVVGPVKAAWKVLVDECANFEKLASHQGTVAFVSRDERKTQEDIHRLRLSPGSSVTYRVNQAINQWQAYLFTTKTSAGVVVECSADGKKFTVCNTKRQMAAIGKSDYGYRLPLLLKGVPEKKVTFLRISLPVDASNVNAEAVQLSRVEIRYGGKKKQKPKKVSQAAPLSPSILLFHKPYHTEGVRAVRRAAKLHCTRVNVVVTLLCNIDKDRQVVGYGTLQHGKYVPLNEKSLRAFQETIQQTFSAAVDEGMDIAILAHLNSWGEVYDWRNLFQFDPLKKYGKYNYQEALIAPIAKAIAATAKPTTHVEFSLAGEMGRSVFAHADSYNKILENLRADERWQQVELGVSLNFNRVSGEDQPTPEQQHQVQQLIDNSDFVGLSNYSWFDLPPKPSDFAKAIDHFLVEMKTRGVTVPTNMPLHFSEIGIGGCTEDGRLTTSPSIASKTPWQGSDRISRNPWKSTEMRNLRVEYHRALLEFLKKQPVKNPVTSAFLWSEGSWDPMDISESGFFDEEIVALIQRHNSDIDEQSNSRQK